MMFQHKYILKQEIYKLLTNTLLCPTPNNSSTVFLFINSENTLEGPGCPLKVGIYGISILKSVFNDESSKTKIPPLFKEGSELDRSFRTIS